MYAVCERDISWPYSLINLTCQFLIGNLKMSKFTPKTHFPMARLICMQSVGVAFPGNTRMTHLTC